MHLVGFFFMSWNLHWICIKSFPTDSFSCLHCVAPVSMHDRLCFVTFHMNVLQYARLLRFSKRTECLCMFSWRICNPLLGESRAAVSKVMMAYTNNGKTSSADRNSGQKPKISERDCCTLQGIVSNNHTTTAARITAERIIHLADHSHKSSPMRASQIHHPGYSCNC